MSDHRPEDVTSMHPLEFALLVRLTQEAKEGAEAVRRRGMPADTLQELRRLYVAHRRTHGAPPATASHLFLLWDLLLACEWGGEGGGGAAPAASSPGVRGLLVPQCARRRLLPIDDDGR